MAEALVEKYLQYVAKHFQISEPDAAQYVDKCIKFTAAKLNTSYSNVYNQIYSEKALTKCLLSEKICSKLEIEECRKSCNCFYLEPYGCLSRKIADADIINSNPDAYIKEHFSSTAALEKIVKIASYLYYNYDGGGLTDNSFDALEYHLNKRLKARGRRYEKIGAPPVKKIRIKLPYPLPSLNKLKPGMMGLTNFLNKFAPEHTSIKQLQSQDQEEVDPMHRMSWSLKLDGVSGMVIYDSEGKVKGVYTRGDGDIGGDVTYLKDYLSSIPASVSKRSDKNYSLVVRGEFIITKQIWKEKYKGNYSNARSFVSGKINAGHISPALPDINFVAYQIMLMGEKKRVPSPSQSFRILLSEGFQVVENGICVSPTVFDVMQLYKEKRQTATYFIDGLVLTGDWSRLSVRKGAAINPLDTIAFKMLLEDQIRDTKATDVEWNISRYGRYVPVVIYESVYIEGVRLHRATGHNAMHIRDWNMGNGTKIKVVRSGDVIPQIKDVIVDPRVIPIYPKSYEEGGYEWSWEKSNIVLVDIEGNPDVQLKRTVHFFSTLGVPRLKEGNVKKFTDAGYTTPEEIAQLSVEEITKIKGFGMKTAETFYNGIKHALSTVPPDRFLLATTSFKTGLGRKLLKDLFRHIPDILDLSEDEIRTELTTRKLKGFGPARIKGASINIPEFRAYLDSFAKKEIEHAITFYQKKLQRIKKEGANPLIEGKTFVLTGFIGGTDYELEDYIYDNNGNFSSSVTSGTEAVVSKTISNVSKKMLTAHELGVPVLDIFEFSRQYDIPLKRFEK